jgi:hypothetical protein
MAKRKPKKKRKHGQRSVDAKSVGEMLRVALRSIIRDWQTLREPLPVDEITTPLPTGAQRFRIRGAESYEELQERVIEFAGRVWQLKDGIIKWLQTRESLHITIAPSNLDTTVAVTCSPKPDPDVMRVSTGPQAQEMTLDETQATQS